MEVEVFNSLSTLSYNEIFSAEGVESARDAVKHPEAERESKGILGTIRDWVTPEHSETQKSALFFTSNVLFLI